MYAIKFLWALRSIINKPFFKHYGKQCYMGKPLLIAGKKNISFGDKVRIQPGLRMETYGSGTVEIQDDVSIAQNFHCISAGKLIIGKKTTISGNTFITNIDHEYGNIGQHIMEQPMIIKDTIIGENCFIGYGVAIQAGTKLGKQCIIGANAVVRGEFPDYCVIVGIPGRVIKRYNTETGHWEKVDKSL
jgi:acetyltransferase-like isoleucine patch superfamily enzyme